MVDSSIGGKTGIDTIEGKNLMGAFYQPKAVIIDTGFLKTLPRKEFINGMAEIIEHAVIRDIKYFKFLENNQKSIMELEEFALQEMIIRSCMIKRSVVERDEKEAGLRKILNFGHTLGHAIKKPRNIKYRHGFSVSLGMVMESFISMQRNLLSKEDFNKINNLIDSYGLLEYKDILSKIDIQSIVQAASADKKNLNDSIHAVLISNIGKTLKYKGRYSFILSKKEIEESYNYFTK